MQSPVIIRCINDTITSFNIMTAQYVNLAGITITGCKSALRLHNMSSLFMEYVSIQNSSYFGVAVDFTSIDSYNSVSCFIIRCSFYRNCIRPPISNNSYRGCSHVSLMSNQHKSIYFNITHSNFSYGMNQDSAMHLYLQKMYTQSNNNGSYMVFISHCLFLKNTGTKCGGLLILSSSYLTQRISVTNTDFMYNEVVNKATQYTDYYIKSSGGLCCTLAMHQGLIKIIESSFIGNLGGGAAIVTVPVQGNGSFGLLVMVANSVFSRNLGDFGAGLTILADKVSWVWIVNTSLIHNIFKTQLSTLSQFSALLFICTSRKQVILVENVTISHNNMTGLVIINCQVQITGATSMITHNSSPLNGGGLWVDDNSFVYSNWSAQLLLSNNRAVKYGGAIYSEAAPFPYKLQQVSILNKYGCTVSGINAVYVNNTAGWAGNDVYGGEFYHCFDNKTGSINVQGFEAINCSNTAWPVLANITAPLSCHVSSAPFGVCLCTSTGTVDCNIRSIHRAVYPGSILALSLVTVGMCGGVSPGQIAIDTSGINVMLGSSDQMTVTWQCKTFVYRLKQFNSQNGYFKIKTGTYDLKDASIIVNVEFLTCPLGLRLSNTGTCECNPVISSIDNVKCNVSWEDTPLRRTGNIWLSYKTQLNCTIANDDCPFDYCNSSAVYLGLGEPDAQCTLKRSGTLCGGCLPGLSLMLGSNKCEPCSNEYVSLLVAFILAGVVLVAFLLAANLTVSVGSINGLLFYANIVKLNEVVLFPNGMRVPVLSQFIAWLNLDLGIETCFFDGLDGYWKTWLQFVFPIYIWLLIGAIIIGSYYSGRLSRVFGNNTVPVLATLILMSYSKLLRTITNALMISKIKCEEEEWSVWSVDANIEYFDFKHSFLFGGSVLFLLVGILYGCMVFSAQWLQKCTGRYCKSSRDPMVKLKPLVDSYTGPYKDKYRFWTGLLIFIRILLTALFSYTTQAVPLINNYIIAVVCVLLIRAAAAGLYRNTALNYLEFIHYFNLFSISLLSELSYHLQWNNGKGYTSIVSVSISMIVFTATVLAHIYVKLERKLGKPACLKCYPSRNELDYSLLEDEELYMDEEREGSPPRVIQRRESLIYDLDIGKGTKLREL